MPRPAVFLDRDGVLNVARIRDGKPYPPANIDDLCFEPGAAEACAALKAAGLLLIGVTNQPDVARGAATAASVAAINDAIVVRMGLDDIRVCDHDDDDQCGCRKPKPGLLLNAAKDFDIDLSRSVMVGDRWRDIEAGRNAGVATVYIDHGYLERSPLDPDHTAPSLGAATPWIIAHIQGA